jgi:hypothetical protein
MTGLFWNTPLHHFATASATRALARELLLPCETLFVALPPPGRQSRGEGEARRQSRRVSAQFGVHPTRQIPAQRVRNLGMTRFFWRPRVVFFCQARRLPSALPGWPCSNSACSGFPRSNATASSPPPSALARGCGGRRSGRGFPGRSRQSANLPASSRTRSA